METNLLNEIKRFVVNYLKKIILVAAGIAIFYSAFQLISVYLDQRAEDKLDVEAGEVQDIADPAVFSFYVETEDGRPYSNFTVIEEYFLLPETLKSVQFQTGTDIEEKLELQKLNEFVKTTENRGVLGISRDASSGIFTFKANVGSASDNFKVATYYYDFLMSGDIPVIDDKNMYIIEEPYISELTEDEVNDLLLPERVNTPARIAKNIIINLVVGTIFGLILALFGAILVAILGKKINYSFTYNWEMNDHHLIVNSDKDFEELMGLILYPSTAKKLVLTDNKELKNKLQNMLEEFDYVNSDFETIKAGQINILFEENFNELNPHYQPDEIVYALQSGKTSKKWYYKQRKLVEPYAIPGKVIQFNN